MAGTTFNRALSVCTRWRFRKDLRMDAKASARWIHLHASEMMLTVEPQHRFAHHQSRPAVANREYGLTLGTGAPRRARIHEVGQLNL